jgi:hypothetical protein
MTSKKEIEQLDYIGVLYDALHAELGLVLQVDDPATARRKFYDARQEAIDPELNQLTIRSVQLDDGNLLIGKVDKIGAVVLRRMLTNGEKR